MESYVTGGVCGGGQFWQLAAVLNFTTSFSYLVVGYLVYSRWRELPAAPYLAGVMLFVFSASSLDHIHLMSEQTSESLILVSTVVFIVIYLFFVYQDVLGMRRSTSSLCAGLSIPFLYFAWVLAGNLTQVHGQAAYLAVVPGVLMLMVLFAGAFPLMAKTMRNGAGAILLCLAVRQVDPYLCGYIPTGTHFIWHLLSAFTMYMFVRGYMKHRLAAPAVQG